MSNKEMVKLKLYQNLGHHEPWNWEVGPNRKVPNICHILWSKDHEGDRYRTAHEGRSPSLSFLSYETNLASGKPQSRGCMPLVLAVDGTALQALKSQRKINLSF